MTMMQSFLKSESGSATYVAVGGLMLGTIISGLALDMANGHRERTRLQIAADAAALAAASNIDEVNFARSIALQTASLNLGDDSVITSSDIEFGHVDEDTLEFVSGPDGNGEYQATRATAKRTLDRDNALDTMLMHLVGVETMEMTVDSIAGARRGGGGGVLAACEDASIISTEGVNTGGGITLTGAICIHGATHIQTGGNDWYGPEVRFSSEDKDNIKIQHYSPGDIPIEQLKFSRTLEPVILPQLDQMHSDIWASVSADCGFDYRGNPNSPNAPVLDDFEPEGTYSGSLLPSFVMNNGQADVVCWDSHTTVQPGDLKPYTIYVAEGGVQFSGNVQQDNIAIIGKARIGVGGGNELAFNEVFFFGNDVGLAGNISWGPRDGDCTVDEYQVYLFGTKSLSLGGWTHGPSVKNVVAVAPSVSPGGNMSATGIYIETGKTIQLGGGLDIHGCGSPYTSEIEIADTSVPEPEEATGSFLMR